MGVAHDDQDLQNDQSADRTQYVMTFPWSANFEPLGLGSILVLSRNMFVYTFLKLFSQFDSNYNQAFATGLPVDTAAHLFHEKIISSDLFLRMFFSSESYLTYCTRRCFYQALES